MNRNILKCDYRRYSPSEISTKNTPNSQTNINKLREDDKNSVLKSFHDLHFDVLNAATNIRYADGNDIRLINLGVIALFSFYEATTSSGKNLDEIIHAHMASLMYKLLTLSICRVDLSIGFDRDRKRRQREITNNRNQKGKFHVRIYIKDFFWFC